MRQLVRRQTCASCICPDDPFGSGPGLHGHADSPGAQQPCSAPRPTLTWLPFGGFCGNHEKLRQNNRLRGPSKEGPCKTFPFFCFPEVSNVVFQFENTLVQKQWDKNDWWNLQVAWFRRLKQWWPSWRPQPPRKLVNGNGSPRCLVFQNT